jgi:hypothetical protein
MRVASILEFPRTAEHPTKPDTGVGGTIDGRIILAAVIAAAALALGVWVTRSRRAGHERVRAGGRLDIVRCPVHGIAYDAELEECTECAKIPSEGPRWPGRPATPAGSAVRLRPLPKLIE